MACFENSETLDVHSGGKVDKQTKTE
jgi:hypothetical protein